jgi:hypothetical protein
MEGLSVADFGGSVATNKTQQNTQHKTDKNHIYTEEERPLAASI